jgi:hypothetical protein
MGKHKKKYRHLTGDALSVERIINEVKKGHYFKKFSPTHHLHVDILPQPNDVTCGPTCLHAVYRYYGDQIKLHQVIDEVSSFEEGGGTLTVWLACHALKRGYEATIYTYNLQAFDPTWFYKKVNLYNKLKQQMIAKKDPQLTLATQAYLEFIKLGGHIKFEDISRDLLRYFLLKNIPILTGLSSTYLYRRCREIWATNETNDVLGGPEGHFVVLSGYERNKKAVVVSDPYATNPYKSQTYLLPIDRVICSILLGIVTHNADFLIIHPKREV